jgi:hypothetical protein
MTRQYMKLRPITVRQYNNTCPWPHGIMAQRADPRQCHLIAGRLELGDAGLHIRAEPISRFGEENDGAVGKVRSDLRKQIQNGV